MNIDRLAIGAGTLWTGEFHGNERRPLGYRGRHLMDGGVPWK